MTRQEAETALAKLPTQGRWGGVPLVDALVALGVLKLDEPMTAREKFKRAMIERGHGDVFIDHVLGAFDEAMK